MKFVSTMYKRKVELENTEFYCPNCGEQTIVRQINSEDFYQGASYFCTECKNRHYLDHCCNDVDKEEAAMLDNMEEKKTVYKLTVQDAEDNISLLVTGLSYEPKAGQTITRQDNRSFIILKVERA